MTRGFYCKDWDADSANEMAAVIASHSPGGQVLDVIAQRVANRARSKITPHIKSGDALKGIKAEKHVTRRGVLDRGVLVDREAIMSIETGHFLGKRELGDSRPWVEGIHFIRRAARSVDRSGRINRKWR